MKRSLPRKNSLRLCASVILLLSATAAAAALDDESQYYKVEAIDIPKDAFLEIGGLSLSPDGTLYICSRRGEIWARKAGAKTDQPATWTLFASGLHETLGVLATGNGDVIVAQRPELTRVRDTNHDGKADRFERIADGWGVTGNYHEYHFGPVRDKAGNLYATLNLGWEGRGVSPVPYRGWAYKVTPKGEFIPFATGLRSPSGVNLSPEGELFVTDNQGDWVATSTMFHVRQGDFLGHPAGLKWEKGYDGPADPIDLPIEKLAARRKLPAVWFPYGVSGHAPAQPIWDTNKGRFGPYAGHIFVGDQTKSIISRVVLEKVGGEYQGVVFPFRRGLGSGVLRFAWDRDGSLLVGGTDRGWGATGGKVYALERLSWTKKVPFEIATMSLTSDGFNLAFSKPADKAAAQNIANYSFQHWGYKYHKTYGSPHVDPTAVAIKSVTVSADGKQARLVVGAEALKTQRVWELKVRDLRGADGSNLLHDTAWYTLNRTRGN